MNYYISDLHFGHKKCIEFDSRPFSSVEEMDAAIIQNWNSKVSDEDDVYISLVTSAIEMLMTLPGI